MAKQRIDSLFNLEKIQKEFDAVNGMLKKTLQAIQGTSKTKPLGDSKNIKDVSLALKDAQGATKKLSDEQKMLNRETKKLTRAKVQLSDANKQNIKDMQTLNIARKDSIQKARAEATSNEFGAKSLKGLQMNVRVATDEYYRLVKAHGESSAAAMKQHTVLQQLQGDYYKAQQATKYFGVNMNEISNATKTANMSIKQMQDELLRLKSVDFAKQGLNPQQIRQLQVRMAHLADGIGDANARIKAMATDTIPLFASGLQTLTSVGQGVTGTMRLMGVENENLEKTMFALMNVSMSLTAIQKAYNDGIFVAIGARIKDITSTKTLTIVRKGEILATRGATKATRLWGKAMKAMPIVAIIAGLAAITVAIIAIARSNRQAENSFTKLAESQSETLDATIETDAKMRVLVATIKNTTTSEEDRNIAIKEYNTLATESGLKTINLKNANEDLNGIIEDNTRLLYARAAAMAIEQQMIDLTKEYIKVKMEAGDAEVYGMDVGKEIDEMYKEQFESLMSLQHVMSTVIGMYDNGAVSTKKVASATSDAADQVERLTGEYEKIATIDAPSLYEIFYGKGPGAEPATQELKKLPAVLTAVYNGNMKALEEMRDSGVITWEQYLDYSNEYYERLNEIAALEEEQAQARIDQAFKFADVTESVFGKIVEVIGNATEEQTQALEQGYNTDLENLQERYDQGLISEAQYNLQKKAIEDQYNAEKLELEKRQFEREKALALAGIAIDTAQAVQKAIAESPATFGLPFSAYALVQGVAQGAVVMSQQFPGYEKGRRGGEAEYAYVHSGEMIDTGSSLFLTPDAETLTYLPKDSSVYTATETEKILNFYGQNNTHQDSGWGDVTKAINDKEFLSIAITGEGVAALARKGDSVINYRNKYKFGSRNRW